MSKQYPYIQNEKNIQGICEVCNETKQVKQIEWRVDWFQGNCEFEKICPNCFNIRKQKQKKEQIAYEKKMEPIWKKQRQKQEKKASEYKIKQNDLKEKLAGIGFDVKEYNNGQWAIGNILDWWTTTGTAIERKSRKSHYLNINQPDKIIKVLLEIN